MRIVVVGSGYVGLVTGACFAESGVNVTCVDVDKEKIMQLREGAIPIYEPGLENMISRNIEKNRLIFTTDLKEGIDGAEVIFIAVGTPPGEDGAADLGHVLECCKRDWANYLPPYSSCYKKYRSSGDIGKNQGSHSERIKQEEHFYSI